MTNSTDITQQLVAVGESTYATRILDRAEAGPCEVKLEPSGRVTVLQYGRVILSATRPVDRQGTSRPSHPR